MRTIGYVVLSKRQDSDEDWFIDHAGEPWSYDRVRRCRAHDAGVFVSGRDVGDQVAALLHAIADRHDTGGCGCTDPQPARPAGGGRAVTRRAPVHVVAPWRAVATYTCDCAGCGDPHMVRDLDPNGPDRGCYVCEACDA